MGEPMKYSLVSCPSGSRPFHPASYPLGIFPVTYALLGMCPYIPLCVEKLQEHVEKKMYHNYEEQHRDFGQAY
jgi:hypothetical protein